MTTTVSDALAERLFQILSQRDFLDMKGLANEVPLFIQTYPPEQEDALRHMVERLASRLKSAGVAVVTIDFFALVLGRVDN